MKDAARLDYLLWRQRPGDPSRRSRRSPRAASLSKLLCQMMEQADSRYKKRYVITIPPHFHAHGLYKRK